MNERYGTGAWFCGALYAARVAAYAGVRSSMWWGEHRVREEEYAEGWREVDRYWIVVMEEFGVVTVTDAHRLSDFQSNFFFSKEGEYR